MGWIISFKKDHPLEYNKHITSAIDDGIIKSKFDEYVSKHKSELADKLGIEDKSPSSRQIKKAMNKKENIKILCECRQAAFKEHFPDESKRYETNPNGYETNPNALFEDFLQKEIGKHVRADVKASGRWNTMKIAGALGAMGTGSAMTVVGLPATVLFYGAAAATATVGMAVTQGVSAIEGSIIDAKITEAMQQSKNKGKDPALDQLRSTMKMLGGDIGVAPIAPPVTKPLGTQKTVKIITGKPVSEEELQNLYEQAEIPRHEELTAPHEETKETKESMPPPRPQQNHRIPGGI